MKYHFEIASEDFDLAGKASSDLKKALKYLEIPSDIVRRVAISMYEAELNMVVHADGGIIDAEVTDDEIIVVAKDSGPGIPDVHKAMIEGFSTASNIYRELGYGAGMGLSNMQRNSDNMSIVTEKNVGTTITMRFNYEIKK